MIKKLPIILLNFTGIYNYESFASNRNITQPVGGINLVHT